MVMQIKLIVVVVVVVDWTANTEFKHMHNLLAKLLFRTKSASFFVACFFPPFSFLLTLLSPS